MAYPTHFSSEPGPAATYSTSRLVTQESSLVQSPLIVACKISLNPFVAAFQLSGQVGFLLAHRLMPVPNVPQAESMQSPSICLIHHLHLPLNERVAIHCSYIFIPWGARHRCFPPDSFRSSLSYTFAWLHTLSLCRLLCFRLKLTRGCPQTTRWCDCDCV